MKKEKKKDLNEVSLIHLAHFIAENTDCQNTYRHPGRPQKVQTNRMNTSQIDSRVPSILINATVYFIQEDRKFQNSPPALLKKKE